MILKLLSNNLSDANIILLGFPYDLGCIINDGREGSKNGPDSFLKSLEKIGPTLNLEFDIDCLRIRDLSEDEEYQEFDKRKSTVFENLKRKSVTTDKEPDTPQDPTKGEIVKPIRAETDSTKLRTFLQNLGNDEEE